MKPSGKTQFIPDFDIKFHQIIEGIEMASVVGNHSTGACMDRI